MYVMMYVADLLELEQKNKEKKEEKKAQKKKPIL